LITRLRNFLNLILTIFSSRVFRGAGEQLAPRLLSLFGSDRTRWKDATDIQKYSGIAPVVERSGKSVWVHRRLARPIFVCQTFHEFAQQTRQRSSWADQFYRRQREKGKSHHSASALRFTPLHGRRLFQTWLPTKSYPLLRRSAGCNWMFRESLVRALGGVLLYFLSAKWVFAVNALCFVVVIFALLQWKGPEAESGFPLENFLESFSPPSDMFDIRRRFKWY
jgi:hypothetical protein